MKIIIATPLWPPELGGPANYARNLAREFRSTGHKVGVVSFYQGGKEPEADDAKEISFVSIRFPTGLRHFLFFCKTFSKLLRADILFALDQFSVGWPATVACLILRRPLVLRLEGDFLWESFVERTKKDITLPEFYKDMPPLILKELFIKRVTEWVLKRADYIVFSSEWRRKMVAETYEISSWKIMVIKNVFPRSLGVENWAESQLLGFRRAKPRNLPRRQILKIENSYVILWAGRMLYLKNLERLVKAFAKVNDGSFELHLVGSGPEKNNMEKLVKKEDIKNVKFFPVMSRDKLAEKYKESLFFVLPSLSEVGPNVIAETIEAGTPFIMTKESGYAEYMNNWGLLVDPLDEADLAAKMRILLDQQTREVYQKKLVSFNLYRSWQEAAQDWQELFSKIIK